MLILTRKHGECIICGENGELKITLVGIKGSSAKLGIDAPKNIPVHREEIYDRIQAQKKKKEFKNEENT